MILLLILPIVLAQVDADISQLVTANNDFGWRLYDRLTHASPSSNAFFSPISVFSSLALTLAGAGGDTRRQMVEALRYGCGNDTHESFQRLLQMLDSRDNTDNCSLLVATGLFTRRRERFLSDFKDIAVDLYNASLQTLDFVGDPEGARAHINEWTSKTTAGNIRQLLRAGSISYRTVATFVNAVYFKALWRTPFEARNTRKGAFFISNTQLIEMEMMTTQARFSFDSVNDLRCRIIELPYSTGDMSMYILLPDDIGLSSLEDHLESAKFDAAVRRMPPPRLIKLTMPKFSLTTTLCLTRTLTAMGMVDLFDGSADLSGVSDNEEMFMSDFVHSMHIDVGEAGTEAAAASVAIIGLTSFPPPVPTFVIDRPFLLLVRERTTGAILFLGRLITSPKLDAVVGTYAADGDDTNAANCLSRGSFLALPVALVLAHTIC